MLVTEDVKRTQMDKDGGAVMKGLLGQPGRLSCWCC